MHAPHRQPNLLPGAQRARRMDVDTLKHALRACAPTALVDGTGRVFGNRPLDASGAVIERRGRMQELDAALFARVLERRRQDQAQRRI